MTELPCATCSGRGYVDMPDPRDSAWFPRPPRRETCRDCMGTRICPAGSPAAGDFDDEYEVDRQGQIRHIPEQP